MGKTKNIYRTSSFVYLWVVNILHFFPNLKILAMHDVIRLKQVEHVKNEKNILQVRKKF